MLRSSTQLVKGHGDDLALEYLWNGNEYSSLENSLKAMEKNVEYGAQQEILALVHVIERPITVHYETQTKALYLEKFTDCPSTYILYQSRRTCRQIRTNKSWATLLSQPENEQVYYLGELCCCLLRSN